MATQTSPTIRPYTADDPETKSADLVAENVERLRELFPEAITEGKIDFDVLKQLLGGAVDQREEKYGLTWHGKRRARQIALTPSTGTLLPCPEESVDWDTTRNLFIEGDNLEVLKLLQKSYAGKVKLIYIDPPYNTGRDLIYPNDFQDGIKTYLEVTGQIEGDARLSSNPDTSGRYHTNWLNLMYPRLRLARSLLRQDGVLICTIDENEQTNLGMLLKDVFDEGSYEHVCVTIVHNPRGVQGTNFSYTHEYAYFVYRRGTKAIGDRKIDNEAVTWSQFRNWGTESERTDAKNCFYGVEVRDGKIVGFGDVCPDEFHPRQTEREQDACWVYPIDRGGTERKWRYARQSVEAVAHLLRARETEYGYEIEIGKNFGSYRTVWTDKRYDANEYGTKIVGELVEDSPFSFPKSLWAVYDCLYAVVGDDPDSIILDFFAGSGTTGHAVYEMNKADDGRRRYILVQLPEPIAGSRYHTIADVTKERLRNASARIKEEAPLIAGDLGFRVFKLAPSNIRAWSSAAEDLSDSLLEHAQHIVPGRTESDLLHELLLKLGLELSSRVESVNVSDIVIYSVGTGALIVCLTPKLGQDDVERVSDAILRLHRNLSPSGESQIVFRDDAFDSDVAKTNMAAILAQQGLKNVRSV
jgi:adenine-specific DNA-methyltransferase